MEVWKDVVGFEGLYQVSSLGRVMTTRRKGTQGGLKTLTENEDGYYRVKLCKDGESRRWMVHRLVYEAFVDTIPENHEINHIDENKKNNRPENLEAVTHVENVRHGTGIERMRRNHYKGVEQYSLDGVLLARYSSQIEASKATGVKRCNICWCCLGKQQTAGGYIWRNAK